MSKVILTHRVKDYAKWRPIYDADEQRRQNAGWKNVTVYRPINDPNNIHMIGEVDDPSNLDKMVSDPELGKLMEEAGVISKPEIIVLNPA